MGLPNRISSFLIAAMAAATGFAVTDSFAQALRDPHSLQLSEHAKADQRARDAMQDRLDTLAALKSSSNPWDIYHLAKAQAWLAFAFDARAQRDNSGAINEALEQCDKLTAMLEAKQNNISLATPIIPSSAKLRDDIWQQAEAMKQHQGFRCAASQIAQFEVELVRAGHAYKELGWRHAKPYLQAVERLAKDAEARLSTCAAPVTSEEQLPPEVAKQPPAAQVLSLAERVHFAYRKAEISHATAQVLEQVAYVLRTTPTLTIELQGHADRRGSQRYNLKLSQQRAVAVREYLVNAGVVQERIAVSASGKARPLVNGHSKLDYARNRRVEFVVSSAPDIRLTPQEDDLQIERGAR